MTNSVIPCMEDLVRTRTREAIAEALYRAAFHRTPAASIVYRPDDSELEVGFEPYGEDYEDEDSEYEDEDELPLLDDEPETQYGTVFIDSVAFFALTEDEVREFARLLGLLLGRECYTRDEIEAIIRDMRAR